MAKTEITMPKLSDTMTEGRLISWKKSVGETVSRGDIIAEVETDKANMELEAFGAGTLLEILVHPGELVPVGTLMGIVGEPGEAAATPPTESVSPSESPAGEVPAAIPEAEPEAKLKAEQKAEPAPPADKPEHHGEERAAPVVRRRARELGIDLEQVTGSAPGGRILLEDLERFSGNESALPITAAKQPETAETERDGELPVSDQPQPMSRLRKAISRTVSDSWRTIPHFYVTLAVRMNEAEEVRRELKELGTEISLNDMVMKAAALAIRKHPLVNAVISGEAIAVRSEINIGFAVSMEDGLLVPVVQQCDSRPLARIAGKSRELARKAREGKLSAADMAGGTFTVSNLGMFGVDSFCAIIHPPQAAILAVGSVMDRVTLKEGLLTPERSMHLTLSADHRILDGAYAARYLNEVKRQLENPVSLLL